MEPIEIFKVLSNETRLNILQWLKEPEKHFPKVSIEGGVCVGDIQEKAKTSQSTVSHYLTMMQKAGLLESFRHGQWTYYKLKEETVQEIAMFLVSETQND
ncbi:transcriptional regulator [Lysinibacillus fusiformis]|uniref:ArsR/SmtB family transcription factor n=1 Tax=Lysinibacillus fusiformis TaxID=28031 RepID=UPI000BBA460F|nr:metalloregulator ArsR/SmtB family transcription factor [Lysinibacillus fusiformis]PCD84860.1 transcriptional regulator [Lysinibacillus fusiformis]